MLFYSMCCSRLNLSNAFINSKHIEEKERESAREKNKLNFANIVIEIILTVGLCCFFFYIKIHIQCHLFEFHQFIAVEYKFNEPTEI